jgi:hypothetical protein
MTNKYSEKIIKKEMWEFSAAFRSVIVKMFREKLFCQAVGRYVLLISAPLMFRIVTGGKRLL